MVSAVSLGTTDTLIQHPAGLTHCCMGEDAKASTGISQSLLRLSVGLEDPEDLWADLEQALDAAHAGAGTAPGYVSMAAGAPLRRE
jgi:cystathionine beta-lyase/cystathionine gamma-synthase